MPHLREIFIYLFMVVFKIVVQSYTYISLPVYYLIQKPNKKLELCTFQRSKQLDASDPYSPWVRLGKIKFHVLMNCKSVYESFQMVRTLYPSDRPVIGFRKILEEKIVTDDEGNAIRVDGKVLRKLRLTDYHWMTYGQYFDKSDSICKGLLINGVKHNDRIVILSETCADNLIFLSALVSIGAVIVNVFATLGDEGIIHAINETNSQYIYTTYDLLPKVCNLLKKCPQLSTVIYVDSEIVSNNYNNIFPQNIKVLSVSKLINEAKEESKELESVPLEPEEVIMISYTSGTTGKPKGIYFTSYQLMEAGIAVSPAMAKFMDEPEKHIYVAYLPQAHSLESSIEIYAFLGGCRIGFATPFTLNESAPGLAEGEVCDLKLLRPTIMITVPLVLDRMRKEIFRVLNGLSPVSADIFTYLIDYKTYWTQKGYETRIVNKLLCPKVKVQFGGRLEHMVVGAAPVSPQLQALIKASLDVVLIQGYGATETFGAVIAMDDWDYSFGRCGAPLNGIYVKLIDWIEGGYKVTDKPNPRGELVIGGNAIASGYYNNPNLTEESFKLDENGMRWFFTGDIGEVFPDGTFKIIDRKKDLIKLANGEFFSLGKIESTLKNCEYVDNICVVGDGLFNYLIALVIPNIQSMKTLSNNLRLSDLTLEKLVTNDQIINTIHKAIVKTGLEHNLNRREIPTKIIICHENWTPDNQMLTAAMKLMRKNIINNYNHQIKKMFN